MSSRQKKRVLFVAEAVTLAHIVRPLVLAQSLNTEEYEIHFACAEGNAFALKDAGFIRWSIRSISSERFLHALAVGAPLYNRHTLNEYVEEDISLLESVRPDLVVGDFRLSLAVSATLYKVPYATITNAHWSPYAKGQFPLPEHPLARLLGIPVASALFNVLRPLIFRIHAQPLNSVRRMHGLSPLGDLTDVYTHADYTLYADVPGLIPTHNLPMNHHYIGPVVWSPKMDPPPWWNSIQPDSSCIYVTLGSSGRVDLLPIVIEALSGLPVTILVATAGRVLLENLPGNVLAANYLPGSEAAKRSQLVICNGGSSTAYQSLAEGTPVIGIASNMDQYLTMGYVERAQAGLLLRAGKITKDTLNSAVLTLLSEESFRAGATKVKEEFHRYDSGKLFGALIKTWLP